jgi:hypothetical protein
LASVRDCYDDPHRRSLTAAPTPHPASLPRPLPIPPATNLTAGAARPRPKAHPRRWSLPGSLVVGGGLIRCRGVAGEVALELVQLLQHCLEVADADSDQPAHVGARLAQRLLVLEQGVGVDDLRRWCARWAAAVARAPGWVLASLKWARPRSSAPASAATAIDRSRKLLNFTITANPCPRSMRRLPDNATVPGC